MGGVWSGAAPFRRLLAGQAISSIGDRITPVALAFAVLGLRGSALDLGLVLAAATAPYVLVLLVGGAWADRLTPRRVMVAADAVRCAVQVCSGALLVSGLANVPELVVLQAAYGTAQAFFDPASTALVPMTVPREHLQRANALMGLQRNAAVIVGPALAGLLVTSVGGGWGLVVDGATFACNAAALATLPAGRRRPARGHLLRELGEGWRAFRERRWLWVSVLHFSAFVGLVLGPVQVLGPLQASEHMAGAASWAAIAAGQGAGAVLGGMLALRLRPARPLVIGFGGLLLTWPALLVALGGPAPVVVVVACAVAAGAALSLFAALWATALQSRVPGEVLSRVSAYDWLGSKAMQPAGTLLAAPLAASLGPGGALSLVATWCVVSTAAVLLVPAVRLTSRASRAETPVSPG